MLNAQYIENYAKNLGADLVGIASMDRFEGAPPHADPRFVFPEAKACIVLAFRIPRGYYRGIEEGTCFATYTAMGYAGLNEVYAPMVLRELCCHIEDFGYEAVPMPNIYLRPSVTWTTQPEDPPVSLPVREGYPRPDIMMDMRVAAYAAGLGEYGYSKVFLTPEFGPLQRFVALLTDADLEPDPIFEGKICDRCKLCAKACTGKAISMTEMDSITIAGHKCEFAKIDLYACGDAYRGGNPEYNPFMFTGVESIEGKGPQETMGWNYYNRHNPAIEGARGCMRECYIHLEKVGRLTKKFHAPFRKREPWKIDREATKGQIVGQDPDKPLY